MSSQKTSRPAPRHAVAFLLALSAGLIAGCAGTSAQPSTTHGNQGTPILGDAIVPDGTEEILLDPEALNRPTTQATGYMRLVIRWPEAPRTLQGFPTTTQSFRLTVTASDLLQPITTTINRTAGAATESVRLVVPTGTNRSLAVEGRNANGRVVASKTVAGLAVQTGQYTPVTVGLETVVGNVAGTVIDPESGLGVAGVTVSSDGLLTMSDASGSWALEDVNAGARTIAFSRSGYIAGSQDVGITAGATLAAGVTNLSRQHWVAKISGTSQHLRCVVVRSATEAFVGSDYGLLLRTVDGGDTWTSTKLPTTYTINEVLFVTQSTGFLVSDDGLWMTTDGGTTWSDTGSPGGYSLHVFDSQNLFWGAGYSTTNAGVTFSQPTPYTIQRLACVSPSIFWCINGSNRIAKSTSSGTSWAQLDPLPSSVTVAYRGLQANSVNDAVVAGYATVNGLYAGKVLRTVDGGTSWSTEFTTPASSLEQDFSALGRFGSGYCAVGANGIIAMQPSGGTWAVSPIVPTNKSDFDLRAVSFSGTSTGFAVGDNGRILKY